MKTFAIITGIFYFIFVILLAVYAPEFIMRKVFNIKGELSLGTVYRYGMIFLSCGIVVLFILSLFFGDKTYSTK